MGTGRREEMNKLAYSRDSSNDLVWNLGSVGLEALSVEVEPLRADELTDGVIIMYHKGQILGRHH